MQIMTRLTAIMEVLLHIMGESCSGPFQKIKTEIWGLGKEKVTKN
jgi:hypothetical protein